MSARFRHVGLIKRKRSILSKHETDIITIIKSDFEKWIVSELWSFERSQVESGHLFDPQKERKFITSCRTSYMSTTKRPLGGLRGDVDI